MRNLRGLTDAASIRGGYVSIGNFDGVHRGHRSMIAALIGRARTARAPAVVFTFDPHPIALLRPQQSPPPLTTAERKLELLAECGVDAVVVYPTDAALLGLSPREFFDRVVVRQLAAQGLVEGPNFQFGHERAGNVRMLDEFCGAAGMSLDVVPPVSVGDQLVSSTTIRRLVLEGNVKSAANLMGSRYRIRGRVTQGARRGRTIGFPTANLEQVRTVLPCDGVYAGRARVGEAWFAAGINVGPNPTFAEQVHKVEVHLIDFAGDLYGSELDVEFLDRLRDTVPFAGIDALQDQLGRDMSRVRALAEAVPAG